MMKVDTLTRISQDISKIFQDLGGTIDADHIQWEVPADKNKGHLTTTISLSQFSKFDSEKKRQLGSPKSLAETLVKQLKMAWRDKQPSITHMGIEYPVFSAVSVAGPGFINLEYSQEYLVAQLAQQQIAEVKNRGSRDKVIVEFTDPNPFKELHIGHLYSNIVGEAISKLIETQGDEVQRVCYQGDVGMHVSKSIWGMQQLISQQFADRKIEESLDLLEKRSLKERVEFLGKSYALGATKYKEDKAVKSEIQKINYLTFISAQENLEELSGFQAQVDYKKFVPDFSPDSENYTVVKQLYSSGRKWSLDYFDHMYKRIGMVFDDFYFESLVGEYGYQIVQEHIKDHVFKESDGAIIFPGSEFGLHDRVFVNSLGFPTYEAKELGLAPEKYRRYPYDRSIIITGNEIDEYFKVLMKALSSVNPELAEKTTHLSHGMVRLPEGKMSSRTGKVITAEWLIDEAQSRILTHINNTRQNFDEEKSKSIATKVGLSAIKFAFLKQAIGKDIAFSFDESLSFSGNSGPYLQYTYVRCFSILQKANSLIENRDIASYFDILFNDKSYSNLTLSKSEIGLLVSIKSYFDAVQKSAIEFAPHHLCTYLYTLAQEFNSFYAHHKVIDEGLEPELQQFRLLLTQTVGKVIKDGLQILGIEVVEEM